MPAVLPGGPLVSPWVSSSVAGSQAATSTQQSLWPSLRWAGSPGGRQSGDLSFVQIHSDTLLWLVEIIVLLRQLSYAIKRQFKAPKVSYKGDFLHFTMSLWHKGAFHAGKGSIIGAGVDSFCGWQCVNASLWPGVSHSAWGSPLLAGSVHWGSPGRLPGLPSLLGRAGLVRAPAGGLQVRLGASQWLGSWWSSLMPWRHSLRHL